MTIVKRCDDETKLDFERWTHDEKICDDAVKYIEGVRSQLFSAVIKMRNDA